MTENSATTKLAVDIGSTVIKVAQLDIEYVVVEQAFHDRDFDRPIVEQVSQIVAGFRDDLSGENTFICSSANGGLKIGIICLTNSFSGQILRNQVLLGGANPIYVQSITETTPIAAPVDLLLVGGGIDSPNQKPFLSQLENWRASDYSYETLAFAGNSHLASWFKARHTDSRIIENPMAAGLTSTKDSIFVAVRDAYLDDLVHKVGVADVVDQFQCKVYPTPEVVNRGFATASANPRIPSMSGASILMDIGGATTDIHYSTEIVTDESEDRPLRGCSAARYVFTDLGVFVSRDSTVTQLRRNPRTYEFLSIIFGDSAVDYYRSLREGELEVTADLLAYSCVFLALDRFSSGRGPGLPIADLSKLHSLAFTGGASQLLNESVVARIINLFVPTRFDKSIVHIDSNYEVWLHGVSYELRHKFAGSGHRGEDQV